MRLDRCLLIACVTLSHACDSKQAPPPAPPVQSKQAAISLVCENASQKVTNQEVLGFLAGLGADRTAKIKAYAVDVGILDCEPDGPSDTFDMLAKDVAVPVMAKSAATVALPLRGFTVVAREQGFWLDGKPVELEKLDALAAKSDENHRPAKSMYVLIDETLPLARLAQVVGATPKQTEDAVLVVRVDGALRGVVLPRTFVEPQQTVKTFAAQGGKQPPVAPKQLSPNLILRHQKSLQKCMQRSLTRDGPTSGRSLDVTITVEHEHPIDALVAGDTTDGITACLMDELPKWTIDVEDGVWRFHVEMKVQ